MPSTPLVILTQVADHYARECGILEPLQALALPADCQPGDLISLDVAGTRHDFRLLLRRWIAKDGSLQLELTLDHPARTRR